MRTVEEMLVHPFNPKKQPNQNSGEPVPREETYYKKEVHTSSTGGEQWLTPRFSPKTLPQRQTPIPAGASSCAPHWALPPATGNRPTQNYSHSQRVAHSQHWLMGGCNLAPLPPV